ASRARERTFICGEAETSPRRRRSTREMVEGRDLRRAGFCILRGGMRLLLIDGHYYVYRSFFAIRELANSRGEPTNAIYGFVKTIRKMIKDLQPDLGVVLWD